MKIKEIEYFGLNAFEISTSKARLIAVAGIGPRIAHFGSAKGRNLLFWDAEGKYKREPWHLRGGHRVWTTRPGADECEETYMDDNQPCKVKISAKGLLLTAPPHPIFGIQKSIQIKVINDSVFEIENQIKNTSDMLWSGGVWGLTCTLPTSKTTYGIPLGNGTAWDSFSMVFFKRWGATQTSQINDPQITYCPNSILIKPKGIQAKRMVWSERGQIGMTDTQEKLSFVKQIPVLHSENYPLNTNTAFYVGPKNFMVELEVMGPEKKLRPGTSLSLPEIWTLGKPIDWAKVGI